jgi:hypothetical protein
MTITPRVIRTIGSGLAGLVQGGAVATLCEGIFHNEPFMEALTKQETLYFAGAWAIGNALYHATREVANESYQRKRQEKIKQYRAERGR